MSDGRLGPRVIQVIESNETRGEGKTMADPVRIVTRYYTLDGDLLAERDPHRIRQEDTHG